MDCETNQGGVVIPKYTKAKLCHYSPWMLDEFPGVTDSMYDYFGKEVTIMSCDYDPFFKETIVKILEDNEYHVWLADWFSYKLLDEDLFEIS